jgi:outer membrane biogenesis lipoprotein LolB
MKENMNMYRLFLAPIVCFLLTGCGSDKTVIPTKELTEEQKKAVAIEDDKIFEEEGGTKQKQGKGKR